MQLLSLSIAERSAELGRPLLEHHCLGHPVHFAEQSRGNVLLSLKRTEDTNPLKQELGPTTAAIIDECLGLLEVLPLDLQSRHHAAVFDLKRRPPVPADARN